MLVDLFEGDAGSIMHLLDAARFSILRDLEAIVAAAQAGDKEPIVEAAHRIRGTSGSIGACALVELSAQIQAAACELQPQIPPSLLAALAAAVDAMCADIAEYARSSIS